MCHGRDADISPEWCVILLDESCIQVAVYDDRLEVTSPGGLYNGLTYEEVMNGHSKIRNKGIANIFSQMGLVEAWGSGAIWMCPGITGNSCHCLKSLFQS